jgi:hypothetical protein
MIRQVSTKQNRTTKEMKRIVQNKGTNQKAMRHEKRKKEGI